MKLCLFLNTLVTFFSSCATFYFAKDVNPNFLKLIKIKNITIPNDGDVNASKIVKKQSYYNLNDFLDKHLHIKCQKLNEANIKLDFFLLIYKIIRAIHK